MKVYKVTTTQIGNKLMIMDGHNALRYIDLRSNKVYVYGENRFLAWVRKLI